jgi:cyclase
MAVGVTVQLWGLRLKGLRMIEKNVVIMPCLDMQNGRVVKGVRFVDIRDAGDPVECCAAYCKAGADEIAMLDITATVEGRATLLDVVKRVAAVATVPFTVGGGISDTRSAAAVLNAGADKISTSSAAFRKPAAIREMIDEFGAERVTVAIDAAQNPKMPSGYEVYIDGGRTATGTDAVEWTKTVTCFGVGTILPTSKSTDGVRDGYDLPLIRKIKAVTSADVVASGGAGKLEHFLVAVEAGAAVLLAASVFHFNIIGISELKAYLHEHGIPVEQ